jgi:hypothetical protein
MGRLVPLLFLLLLAVAACATPLPPAQQAGLEAVEVFVAATTRTYGVAPIHVRAATGFQGAAEGGGYQAGWFFIVPRLLTWSYRDALVAHEVGHYLLHHDVEPQGFASLDRAGWHAIQARREMDANATAVEILTRVKGWPEATVLEFVAAYLGQAYRQRLTLEGHGPVCEEIRDLLRRYAQHPVPGSPPECRPLGAGGAGGAGARSEAELV